MKIKINKNFQPKISKFKKMIEKHRKEEDAIYARLVREMLLTKAQDDTLFDHIYNDSMFNIEYD